MTNDVCRRKFLMRGAALGCSAAASPLITPIALANAPWDTRLVVIVLRGGMDGLDVVQPYGDPAMAALRPNLKTGQAADALDLDGFYAMHPSLAPIYPLWQAGQLGFVHAVSTPYRDKRSHFDGQDILEAGITNLGQGVRDGWLNRLLQVTPGIETETAFAVGRERMLILEGDAPSSAWAPRSELDLSPQAERLLELIYHDDPLFREASRDALLIAGDVAAQADLASETEEMLADNPMMGAVRPNIAHVQLAEFAASRLRGDTRIASFSLNGWDTHNGQKRGIGNALRALSETILTLQAGLGAQWGKTAVICMTEFGRTARENGTNGTDHGTGGAMVLAGGAVRGGRVVTDWPGLSDADLYAGRDLMPTRDVRAIAGWALRDMIGMSVPNIENIVFPGVELGQNPGIIL
ncbi:DUF1501 domain-containing protein [Aestuariibius sp. HNIBRBA575]|uniref:DUF1501 domain-containing protein n=1 Tax=Aestuariibius sp. HNIBRBA575 TaxID=3233343 RepID=UPI0034A3768A